MKMKLHLSSLNPHHHYLSRLSHFDLHKCPISLSAFHSHSHCKLNGSNVRQHSRGLRHKYHQVKAIDGDSFGTSWYDDWGENEGTTGYMISSSDGEDSDADILLNPVSDIDLPTITVSNEDSLKVTAHRLAMLGRGRKKHRIKLGVLICTGLIVFLTLLLLYVDWCAWKIVRLPLAPFHLTRPFLISTILSSFLGYIVVPFLDGLVIRQIVMKKGPLGAPEKRRTPTMGGLFFVPIGVAVAKVIAGFSSTEVSGAAAATLSFAAIGLLDDILSLIKNKMSGLSAWTKVVLEVAVGAWFSFWLDTTSISSPYSMKMLVPLPAPLGLVCVGKCYLLLTSFCFVSMANGINLTDGLDGLAGGTAALAFVGMSIAVLPICSDVSIFGASMAGACVGFLLHNRYQASVSMGDTGSLALGGALAAMAACTGMFFPLLISSGIFVVEASSVIMQKLCVRYHISRQRSACGDLGAACFGWHLFITTLNCVG
ncbi:Glycos_transf_4 domain-containing protein/MraY_sig1 domain-containing protein [Cephalotus follicularis]|uniref:Glycos_transf_4 domain-containing protein/MraY_sig1 domain-containing protein n=1 Tax=Cephalotus follicularis TaxID=3775 RepID=A0A1Q3CQB8_CEPFO|nr:Glycos_transf_4 domain-containing protein/MraY_sig1 domain-containing protein [Cephalotus follicularis]